MSNQYPIGLGSSDPSNNIDQNGIEKGRIKTIRLFLTMICLSLIISIYRDVLFSNMDTYNVINVFFRIIFEFILFIFLYRGKPWVRITIIVLTLFRIVFQVINLYYHFEGMSYNVIISTLIILLNIYACYFLIGDKYFLAFFKDQSRLDRLTRESNRYQTYN